MAEKAHRVAWESLPCNKLIWKSDLHGTHFYLFIYLLTNWHVLLFIFFILFFIIIFIILGGSSCGFVFHCSTLFPVFRRRVVFRHRTHIHKYICIHNSPSRVMWIENETRLYFFLSVIHRQELIPRIMPFTKCFPFFPLRNLVAVVSMSTKTSFKLMYSSTFLIICDHGTSSSAPVTHIIPKKKCAIWLNSTRSGRYKVQHLSGWPK